MGEKKPLLVVFPRGQLTPKDKERMTKAGILAVEADDPQLVCQMHLTQPLLTSAMSGDAVVQAALSALVSQPTTVDDGRATTAGKAMAEFTRLFCAAIDAARSAGEKT